MKAFKWAVALLVTFVFGTSLSAQEIEEDIVFSNPYKNSVDIVISTVVIEVQSTGLSLYCISRA